MKAPDVPRAARKVVASFGGPTAAIPKLTRRNRKKIRRAQLAMARRYGVESKSKKPATKPVAE